MPARSSIFVQVVGNEREMERIADYKQKNLRGDNDLHMNI
jgi:hypothetical protein